MSCLYVTTHRTTYLKFSLYYFYRQLSLSTNDYRTSNPMIVPTSQFNSRTNVLGKHVVNFSKMISQSKRSVTVHMPPATEDKQSPPRNFSDRIPFQFPPGNPNDKPKLEHLRFIENQLIQILPHFCKQMHPYALYTADVIFENYYEDPPKIMKGAGSYALALFWIRTKLNFKLMNITIHLLKTTVDEESSCVKVRWRVTGLSNSSFVGVLKGWKKPKDVAGNIRDYIENIDGLSTFYLRGDGRIVKHRVDRVMIDENKELSRSPLTKKKLPATAPVSS